MEDPQYAPTALKFLNSDNLGKEYENDLFVAEFTSGNIFHFNLSGTRTSLSLNGTLSDRMADTKEELRISFSLKTELALRIWWLVQMDIFT